MKKERKAAIIMATLESHNHIAGDIERGIKIYEDGGVDFTQYDFPCCRAIVSIKGVGHESVTVTFSKDGLDLNHFHCSCAAHVNLGVLCSHIIAAVLTVQGGIILSNLVLGKSATAGVTVADTNTAKSVGSGSLDVFATPMMISLMERAACNCLSDCMEPGQTSVGTEISVSHTSASLLGEEITATAIIKSVFGRKVEFKVTAIGNAGEIGNGRHIRVVVDTEKFIKKVKNRN
ncbi:MAG: thioesterase family protein [Eubacterium sp.]|jgi:predicted thioesterase|nr:thioesterase family protein [Eubacterium sp.]